MILKRTNSFELLKTLIWIMRKGPSLNQNQRPVQPNIFQRSRTCGAQYYSCQKQQQQKKKKKKKRKGKALLAQCHEQRPCETFCIS